MNDRRDHHGRPGVSRRFLAWATLLSGLAIFWFLAGLLVGYLAWGGADAPRGAPGLERGPGTETEIRP